MRRLISLALFALAPGLSAQGFYEMQLRAGQAALANGRPQEAADDARIAAFGFLDRPALLCEALETQAIAQEKAGQGASADATLARLADISRGFPGCREARLDPALRADFESLARRKLPAAVADQLLAAPPPPTAAPATQRPAAVAPTATARPTAAPSATAAPAAVSPAAARAAAPTATPTPVPPPSPSPVPTRQDAASLPPADDLDRQPQLKITTRPVYPAGAQRAGVGGIVLLKVLVSERGEPSRIEIARGVQPDLDQAAVAAVRQWLFEPGQKGGKAVAAWMTVAVPFDAPRR